MADTEYFSETAQPRDHIPLNTMWKSQSHTVSLRPQPRIIF